MRSSRPQAELFDLDCSGRHRGKFSILDAIAWSDTSSHVFKVNCGLVCILMRSGAVFFSTGWTPTLSVKHTMSAAVQTLVLNLLLFCV